MKIDSVLGWFFMVGAIIFIFDDKPVIALEYLILAKLCWIHGDIKEPKHGASDD